MRKAWAFALWSPISRERQKTKNDSQCESFLLRSLSPTELIRCSRIASDEENVNKLLCGVRLRDFCDGELNYTGYESERSGPNHWTRITQGTWNKSCGYSGSKTSQGEVLSLWARVQLHENDSQCESFFIYFVNFIPQIIHSVNDFWAVWEYSRADILESKTFAILFYSKNFIIITYTL